MKMPSAMAGSHRFSQVPNATIPRSQFDRSHRYKTTFDGGYLIPIYVDEALPGDTFALNMTGFARLATPLKPLMDNMTLSTFFFFVPYRLVWDNWEKFNGAQANPTDSTDFTIPQITLDPAGGAGFVIASLYDYFGIPAGSAIVAGPGGGFSALPFRAYNLIWNEWFRDQNLDDSLIVDTSDGPEPLYGAGTIGNRYLPRRRRKRHDYFTSCLPWPQKGDSVTIGLAGVAPVVGTGVTPITDYITFQDPSTPVSAEAVVGVIGGGTQGVRINTVAATQDAPLYWDQTALEVDLSTASAVSINELRQAFQVQKLLERDARGGTRYTEVVRAHFGVTSPDARLQRPEYLGGGSTPVLVSPIAQTSVTDSTPQGNLAAIGTASWRGHGFTKSFTEHGVLIGLASVQADLTYQYGRERFWDRQTRFDFYWPALAHIGEQAVLNKEIFFNGAAAGEDVFGYQERFAEYRYKPSYVTGLFRSNAAGSLDVWHLAQEFTALPELGADFIKDDPPIDRVIAVDTEPHFLLDSYFSVKCARPMPVYGVPGLIDHF